MLNKIAEAVAYIRGNYHETPLVAIILGSGLGSFTTEIEDPIIIPYKNIPHFPLSTVEGHSGNLIFGRLKGKMIVAMSGRFHYYEGYSAEQIIFPIRLMKLLGVQTVLLSNAAGSVSSNFQVGDLMIITDHISQFILNPLIGKNDEALGPRFPDMSEPYSKKLIKKAKHIASANNLEIKEGVYIGVTGPTFETRAEYRMILGLGADAVGMSTVPEVIAAVHLGMTCFAISVITDIGIRDDDNKITHEEVLKAAREAEPKFTLIFKELIGQLQ